MGWVKCFAGFVGLAAAAFFVWSGYLYVLINCGLRATYASGTIIRLDRALTLDARPSSTEPDRRLGYRPVIQPDIGGASAVMGAVERAPTSRGINDRVQVCYDKRDTGRVYII